MRIEGYATQKTLSSHCNSRAGRADVIVLIAFRYDSTGFIVNDIQVQGAVFCVADFFTLWDLKSWQDVTPDSLSLLQLYKPAPGNPIFHLLSELLKLLEQKASNERLELCLQIW